MEVLQFYLHDLGRDMEAQKLNKLVKITWSLESDVRMPSSLPTPKPIMMNDNEYDNCLLINIGLFFPYHPRTIHLLS